MKRILFFIVIISFLFGLDSLSRINTPDIRKMDDTKGKDISVHYVPNEETAKKIAEAIWLPIYGEKIYNQRPYVVTSLDSIWIVEGTLSKGKRGGVAYIEIQKKDCKILKVTHGK